MKYLLLLFFLYLPSTVTGQNVRLSKSDEIMYISLSKINKKSYIGKPVALLLKNKKVSSYKKFVWITEPVGRLNGVYLVFSDKLSIKIFVNDYVHLKRFSSYLKWSFEDFKKEKISDIEIVVQ